MWQRYIHPLIWNIAWFQWNASQHVLHRIPAWGCAGDRRLRRWQRIRNYAFKHHHHLPHPCLQQRIQRCAWWHNFSQSGSVDFVLRKILSIWLAHIFRISALTSKSAGLAFRAPLALSVLSWYWMRNGTMSACMFWSESFAASICKVWWPKSHALISYLTWGPMRPLVMLASRKLSLLSVDFCGIDGW